MEGYLLTKNDIEKMDGVEKVHFLNPNAQRLNKSLGDAVGLTGLGFHIIEVPSQCYSTEFHKHYYEDECVYILKGRGQVIIGSQTFEINAGDFIGFPKGGEAHTIYNTGNIRLKMIVVGERLAHDITDYPNQQKRLYRNQGMIWDLVNLTAINHPK